MMDKFIDSVGRAQRVLRQARVSHANGDKAKSEELVGDLSVLVAGIEEGWLRLKGELIECKDSSEDSP